MKLRLIVSLALVLAIVPPAAAEAGPEAYGPEGPTCSVTAVPDPNPEADGNDRTGAVSAGPLLTTEHGTLVCTIQVGDSTHDGSDAAVRSGTSDNNGVVAFVQAVSYSASDDVQDYVCTSWVRWDGGGTVYWDAWAGHWVTNRTAPCAANTRVDPPRSGVASITIEDVGNGPDVSVTGLEDGWFCYEQMGVPFVGVVCDRFDTSVYLTCLAMTAAGTSLLTLTSSGPGWGQVETWAICEGDWVAEMLRSGPAYSGGVAVDARAAVPQVVTRLYCQARGISSSNSQPQPNYLAQCLYLLG